jgi:hypothetical protein
LSIKNAKKRLKLAKMHKDWTMGDWNGRVFSNETRINLLYFDGISWCWICDYKKPSKLHYQIDSKTWWVFIDTLELFGS